MTRDLGFDPSSGNDVLGVATAPGYPGLSTGGLSPGGLGAGVPMPGQSAAFTSAPLAAPLQQTGSATAAVRVSGTADITVFAAVYDVDQAGNATLPFQLRALMGLVYPDAGTITIFGQQVRPGAPALSRLGSFVEGPGFLPHLSGRANLDLYWRATGRPAAGAHLDEVLQIAGLGTALDRRVRSYSRGMSQRLAIAQAMLGLPDLLVLDEPMNGLDPPQIREMRDVLLGYAAAGRTVILSSHLLGEVEQTCTHLVVMHRGRGLAAGPVTQITGDGAALVVGTSQAQRAVTVLRGLDGIEAAEPHPDGVVVHPNGVAPSAVVAALVGAGIPVDRIGPGRRLEDAFLDLIGASGSDQ